MFEQLAGDQKVGKWVRDVLFQVDLSERTAEADRSHLGRVALNCSSTAPLQEPTQLVLGIEPQCRDASFFDIEMNHA